MIEVTFQFKTVDEAIVALGRLTSVGSVQPRVKEESRTSAGNTASPTPTEGQSKRGRGRPRKNATAASKSSAEPSKEGSGAPAAAPSAPAPAAPEPAASPAAGAGADQAAAQGALEKVFNKHGIQAAQSVLGSFGVSRLRDLKPADYAAFVAACEKAL